MATPSPKNSFTHEELIQAGHGNLFDPESPRLPLPNMLMIDRIAHIAKDGGSYGKGEIVAELDINPDLWFFDCHFETELAGFYMGWAGYEGRGRALGVKEVKFTGQILPTAKKVTYRIDVRRLLALKLTMIVADGSVEVDGRTIYTAKDLKVGLFSDTSGF